MTFLLIEDDEVKRTKLDEFLRLKYPGVTVRDTRSLQSGLRSAIAQLPTLVLLDMNLPTYDITFEEAGGRIQQFAGREFLRQLRRRNIRVPVVVVTQFDYFGEGKDRTTLAALDVEMREKYPEIYIGSVFYHATLDDWKEVLSGLIEKALGGSRREI
jgi:DNA-binding NarL/FixJ family response regulator